MKKNKPSCIFALGLFLALASISTCHAECEIISLLYHERPPYADTTETGAKGLTATPAGQAFERAGIRFQWELTPSKRQMKRIQNDKGCFCAIGWFKNPDREKIAKFTDAIYQDKPQIALAKSDNKKLKTGMSLDEVLSDPDIIVEIKDGYSYGSFLDAKIAQHAPKTDVTTQENTHMLKKIHLNRADFFFIAPEEADILINASGLPKTDFKYISFPDMPLGEKRYIMCSKKVKDAVIRRINTAINR